MPDTRLMSTGCCMFFFKSTVFWAAQTIEPSWHKTWPFGPGIQEGFLSVALKALFILAILGGMAWLLRFLFGPGGPLRDKEFDEVDEQKRVTADDKDQPKP